MLEKIPFKIISLFKSGIHFGEYVESSKKGKIIFILLGLLVILAGSIFPTFCGFLLLHYPNFVRLLIWSILFLICIVLIAISLLSLTNCVFSFSLPIKQIIGELLGLSLIAYVFLFFFCTSIGMFRIPGWLPERLEKYFVSESIQYPILNPTVLIIDKGGGFFIGLQDYGRIQKYNSLGTFEKGWNIDTGGGKFYLWKTDHDSFCVYAVRTRKYLSYDIEGNLIDSETISFSERDNILPEMPINKIDARDRDGNHFVLKKDLWTPEVVKIKKNGEENVLLKDPYGFLPKTIPMFIIASVSAIISVSLFIAWILI